MDESFLYRTNEFIIQCVFFLLMMTATEVGFRLGCKFEARAPASIKTQISTVEAAILGILALLLGFTMSMAVSRFDLRRQLMLDEANAIGTSYLRAQLLPAPQGPEVTSLLRRYINLRVQYGTAGNELAQVDSLHAQTGQLQTQLWTQLVAYAQQDPSPVRTGLLLQSMNQAFDLEAARWMAFQNRVPESVIYVNGVLGLLAAMLVGYTFGVNGRRNLFSMTLLALSITLVLAVITDLDRPRSGFIRASQQPMIDLQHRADGRPGS